jgi:cell shape-determining protein MreC
MFSRIVFNKKGETALIDMFLDHPTYEKFKAYIAENHLDESSALVKALKHGMTNYWLQEFKQIKESYLHVKKLFKEYKKDNETLKALQEENEQLRKILE